MKRFFVPCLFFLLACHPGFLDAAEPLRLFLRGGPKTHGPAGNGLHDHERWVKEWSSLLAARGAKVQGGLSFPSAEQLAQTDVLVMFAADAGKLDAGQRASLDTYLKRGGGIVCFHDAVCGDDAPWFKTVIGGAWEHGHSKWFENEVSFYYVDPDSPITAGASNFDIDDEVYWDLHLMPEARILAASWQPDKRNNRSGRPFPHIYGIIPQMWTYEKDGYRSFVSILGHKFGTFEKPHVRAVLLRGIAWAGRRDIDSLCSKEELASLRYPEGGPVAPEKAAALIELHPEFNLSLAAAEPLINKPMNIDWDPAGRLWVTETPEYPNGRYGLRPDMSAEAWMDHGGLVARSGRQDRPARDRISWLSDSDGDGRMDRKEVFYDGLELVTSMVFHRDGVIVAVAPDLLWLRDRDGDGRAETVEKLYTGLGIGDRHATINNLRWGFDGWIYATHGYSAGDVTTADGSKMFGRIGSGVVRFKADGSAFEQFSSKGGNTWGLDIAWDNEVFFTQPTSGDLLNHVVLSEASLARGKSGNISSFRALIQRRKSFPLIKSDNLAYVQIDQVGFFTASAGCAIYDGGTWPAPWNYSYFTTEPTINLLHHEVVSPEGASYQSAKNREAEFAGGRDLWFRPIETRVGPDGALYVIDFYNQAVIHNDTRGPRHNLVNAAVRPDRDHYFGRIWRIDHKQARHSPVPNLSKASSADLVKALELPNRHVRMNAFRLLLERGGAEAVPGLNKLAASGSQAYSRVLALWALGQLGALDASVVGGALASPDSAVRKNAARAAQLARPAAAPPGSPLRDTVLKSATDPDPRVRLEAILALAQLGIDEKAAAALVAAYPTLRDPWLESAVIGCMAQAPLEFLNAAFANPDAEGREGLVEQLSRKIADARQPELAARLVIQLARQPAAANTLKQRSLEALGRSLGENPAPAWTGELQSAFRALLGADRTEVAAAALPLIARWDTSRSLAADTASQVQSLLQRLDAPDQGVDQRASLAAGLLGVRQLDARIVPAVASLLQPGSPAGLKQRVIQALGATGDRQAAEALAKAYPTLDPASQEAALGQIMTRAEWSQSFLNAIQSGAIDHATLRPSVVHALRNHSNPKVASAANTMFDTLRGPEMKEKNALVEQFLPLVQRGGDAAHGKELFTLNCAVCHRFEEQGRDVGPNLSGMGAHGPSELIVHILDPNRAVEDNFVAVSVETKDGETHDGILARENQQSLILRHAAGEVEIAKRDITSRRATGKSLMPEGFEALGGEGLRDVLGYMTAADSKFRFLDLAQACTADTRQGLYISQATTSDTLKFKKFGPVSVEGVPFNIVDPARAPGGRNVVVLKGGDAQSFSRTLPQQVEVKLGFAAKRLHFLGGVAGWGYPIDSDGAKDKPVMKATLRYAGGDTESWIFRNGQEFADYIREVEVPGSKLARGVVTENQVRYFSKPLQRDDVIESLALESYDNRTAPTTVAITAELAESGAAASQVASASGAVPAAPRKASNPIRVLITGGGSSHDFEKWFNQADIATLSREGLAEPVYSGRPAEFGTLLEGKDVLCQTANQPIPDLAARKAILGHAESGKGLLIVHAGLWYNWNDWPEYNLQLCGGGSRGHDRLGEFKVEVSSASHPVMAGVPADFQITDELYYFQPDPKGPPIEVLATAHSKVKDATYPMVWIVKHPKARVVGIALGHDGSAHNHPAYQRILRNALAWAAAK